MKLKNFIFLVIPGVVLLFSGCGNREMKEEAAKVGDAMCRNIGIMNKIRNADPEDSVTLKKSSYGSPSAGDRDDDRLQGIRR